MRLLLLFFIFWSLQPAGASIRFLLRDEQDAGVAGATLTLRLQDGRMLDLTTDAQGLAQSGELPGEAVWLLRGRLADGRALLAESYPPGVGFRLVLLPRQDRDVLLRFYDSALVLDPDMIFSPNEPGEPTVEPPPQLAAPARPAPRPDGAQHANPCSAAAQASSTCSSPAATTHEQLETNTGYAGWLLPALMLAGVLLCGAALAIGITRRRASA